MEICINEVEKVFNYPRPNFLIMLGNRYGWVPVPTEIDEKYYDIFYLKLNGDEKNLFDKWYKKDENSIPYKYILQPIDKVLGKENQQQWFDLDEKKLVKIITNHKDIFPIELNIGKSATEQEIIKGVLSAADKMKSKDDSVLCIARKILNEEFCKESDFIEDQKEKLYELKKKIKECSKPIVVYEELTAKIIKKEDTFKPDKDYLEDYSIMVKNFLKEKIKNEIDRLSNESNELEEKIHKKFKDERAKVFFGREEILKNIKKYILDKNNFSPFVVYGDSGVGKSAFMSMLIKELEELEEKEIIKIIYRFIGISEISSQPKLILDNLSNEISKKYNISINKKAKDYSDSIKNFLSVLDNYAKIHSQTLVIVIDALDQFETKNSLEWINSNLPKNIKIILSTLPSEYGEYYEILKTKVPQKNLEEIKKLTVTDGRDILSSWLKLHNKNLTTNQFNHIINLFEKNGLPLFLKILFDQSLTWRSYDEKYLNLNEENLIDAVRAYFKNLVNTNHHSSMLVEHTIGYISASKNGLSENEIVEVLSSDYIIMKDISNSFHKLDNKLPSAVWSRLYYDLLKYFTFVEFDGESLISFYHRKIKECARDYYYHINKEFYHVNLLEYFWNQPTIFKENKKINLRKIAELIWLQFIGHRKMLS